MHEHNPGIDRLLVLSALDADLRRRLLDSPDEVFAQFDLTAEEQDLLRHPDHRLLPLLGSLLTAQQEVPHCPEELPPPLAVLHARTLPDISLAVTVVPCARIENGVRTGYSYAVWVNPLPPGVDPASLQLPEGTELPGPPLAPLHVVMQLSAIEIPDASGQTQVGLSASLRQSSNLAGPPPGGPLASKAPLLESEPVRAAVAAVRSANQEQRYDRLIDLIHALNAGQTP